MRRIVFIFFLIPCHALALILTPDFPQDGVVLPDSNSMMDPKVDYSYFMGRITDRNRVGEIFKVQVENNNSKFLKAGDIVLFKVNNQDNGRYCKASIRTVEDYFFSMYVDDFKTCFDSASYIPRGLQLNFKSNKLADRVFEASKYRELLILRKESFLKQLNGINKFIWTFDQQRLQVAADYDREINDLLRKKQLAIDNLIQKKQENLMLQTELKSKLRALDESLDHYKVERKEYLLDRWAMDQDLDLPVSRRPLKRKKP